MSGNEAGDGGGDNGPISDDDLSERLKRLEARLDRKRPSSADSGPASHSDGASLGQAMRLSTEFVAGVIAGAILGWLFDRLVGTAPWGLIVFLVLGFVTGIYNVMRLSGFTGQVGGKDPQ